MNALLRVLLSVFLFVTLSGLQFARGQGQVSQLIWQLGVEDGGQSEFTGEANSNDPPGSATEKDDDFYFAGTYPDPIGVVGTREPWSNYDRALTPGDPRNRIHFNMDKNTASATNELKLTVAFCCRGAVDGNQGTHDIVVRFNGAEIYSTNGLAENLRYEQIMRATDVGAVVGENVVEIERIDGSGSSWIQFDFVRLEIPASDTDGDGLPDSYEKLYPSFLNPNDKTDAAKDQDADGLTNLEEFTLTTDPTKPDSDGDGLTDGDEVHTQGTNPLAKDSDGDGLTDADEINTTKTNPKNPDTDGDGLSDSNEVNVAKTDPTLADTDGDTYTDGLEVDLGSNPLDPADKPTPFTQLWLLGLIDSNQAEFSGEVAGSPAAPGSAEVLDDDYYFAGTYPDPIYEVAADEPFTNFERALTPENAFSRIHFNLSAAQVKTNSEYLLTFNLIDLGSAGGSSVHDISFRFNGNEFHKETGLASAKKVEQVLKATEVMAVEGENIIELERTGGTGTSWVQFDYVQADYREVTTPVARPKLAVARSGNDLVIQWTPTGGTLESTESLANPVWTVVGTANPATIQTTTGNRFYRVKR